MARAPRNEQAAAELGEHLAKLAKTNPHAHTAKAIERWLYKERDIDYSVGTIRKAHHGEVDPTTAPVDLLAGLAAYYGVAADELGPVAEHRIAAARVVLLELPDPDPAPAAALDRRGRRRGKPRTPREQAASPTIWLSDEPADKAA